MPPQKTRTVWLAAGGVVLIAAILVANQFTKTTRHHAIDKSEKGPIPVEVAEVRVGPLSFHRTFSGTIDPFAQVTVAPKVSGSVKRLYVDTADSVFRGQVVVDMDAAEFEQEVLEAEARVAVAEANRVEAKSRLDIAQRELARAKALNDRGIASESSYDTAQAQFLTSQAAVKVAEANVKREEALLRATRIRLGYTRVRAEWQQGDDQRIVAERFVNEGSTVAANTPLISVVEIDLGQQAMILADAFPEKSFIGTVSRISPVFRESSRQARIELEVVNSEQLLKPGMFVRCVIELYRAEKAVSVPETAVTKRDNQLGVFKIAEDGTSVQWETIRRGFASDGQVQLLGPEISGKVVTLGQQFITDGAKVRIVSQPDSVDGGLETQ
ncbi:MAG: efflux RND transporter periplasmic adaptor subunit [Desulforhopalus sp.]